MRETEMKPQLMLNAYAKIGKMMLEQNGIECFDASYATWVADREKKREQARVFLVYESQASTNESLL